MLELKANTKQGCHVMIEGNFVQTIGELAQCINGIYDAFCHNNDNEIAETYKALLLNKDFIEAAFKIGEDHGKMLNRVIFKEIIESEEDESEDCECCDEKDEDDDKELKRLKEILSMADELIKLLEGIEDDESK